jgi:hypothetical protein
MVWNEIPFDPCHLGVPSGASKTIFEPMVRNVQTVHLSRVKYYLQMDKVTWVLWHLNLVRLDTVLLSVYLEIVIMLTQDRCTVCAECTIGSEIILAAPDGIPRWCGSCGISFPSFLQTVLVSVQDRCTFCAKHIIGLEIILDVPDRAPTRCGSCGISFRSVWRQC